jgi:MFS family permease
MSATAADPVTEGGPGWASTLWHRQLDTYPDTGRRILFLAITVLATITLYYELYVGASVTTLILPQLGMTFSFYVTALAFGNLLGAFGSLFAGLADRVGRSNLVVWGLLFTGVFTAFVIPAATSRWPFIIETFVVGIVEGMCLVATPALIRDFSPQVGRASAMGFWTAGPVVGSLVVAVVASNTIPNVVGNSFWSHEYKICGVVGLVVFVITFLGLRELSPRLRDQLMVTMRDRALIEARAKGIDIEAALKHPFRQLLKPDVVISSVAVSVMLLVYYTAVAFGVVYLATVFAFSTKDANGLGNWNWGFNVLAVILVGVVSDRLRVRKPFMVLGGIGAAVMLVIYLMQAGHHPSYYTLAAILAVMSFFLGVAYTPWMASFTETVEDRNPALIATGLAIWGWIVRVTVFASFLIIPAIISSVTPLVTYGPTVSAYAAQYKSELAFAQSHAAIVASAQKYKTQLAFAGSHPTVVASAQKYKVQLANAQKFAPELAVLQAHQALFAQLARYTNPAKIPPALQAKAVAAAGGGAKGIAILESIAANKAAITGVVAVAPQLKALAPYAAQLKALAPVASQLQAIAPYAAQLKALAKVPPAVFAYLKAHGAAVSKAAATTAGQWKTWYWICFGGIVFFLLCIPLLRGRWSPGAAKKDEVEHEAMVAAELAKLHG